MNDELRRKLLSEINRSGFSHELDIIQRLRDEKLVVFPNLAYVDADDKPHEIDAYVAITNDDRQQTCGDVSLSLIVECKASSDKPWVFFDDPGDAHAFRGLVDRLICLSDFEMQAPYTMLAGCMNSALNGHHYNGVTTPKARTHLEAFGKDAGKEIYQGVTGLWYAIDYFKRLFTKSKSNRTLKNKRVNFIHPVIVFKGTLVSARRDGAGFQIEEVPHVILRTIDCITDKDLDFKVFSKEIAIDIVRDDFLETYVRQCRHDLELCIGHAEQIFQTGWMVSDSANASPNT